jgi:serine/threonine protein kinase/tetratricopeptide (TPR) repeat protein
MAASQVSYGNSSDSILVDLFEEIAAKLQSDERVDWDELARKHPEQAEPLRRLLPTIQVLADLGRSAAKGDPSLASVAAPAELERGVLGDFRILCEIGRGGMGVVYQAEQLSLGRQVALKVLPFAAAMDPKQLQRFKHEAQAAAHLHHTNIVPVISVGCDRGVHYYVMQYIEGQPLSQVIHELRGLAGRGVAARVSRSDKTNEHETEATGAPESSAINAATTPRLTGTTLASTSGPAFFRTLAQLGLQAAEALEHAHGEGVIHRDIKPANLLVEWRAGSVSAPVLWITDFGLALCQSQPGLTMTGDFVGTLRYMSPEQALAKRSQVDHRTDVYSLAATLYELLTLEPAMTGHTREELLREIAYEDPRPLRRLNRAVPAELETIILKALAKSPEERYATAKELADDLRRFLEDKPIRAKRPSLRQRVAKWARRHKPVVVTAALSAAVLVMMTVAALVAGYIYVSAEKDKKQEALEEKQQALQLAEANLQLAWEAVDEIYEQYAGKFSSLPQLQHLRRELLEKALGFYQKISKQKRSADPEIRMRIGRAYRQIGAIQVTLGQPRRGTAAYLQAIALLDQLVAEYPAEPRYQAELAGAHSAMGFTPSGEQSFRRAIALWARLAAECPEDPAYRQSLANCYIALGGRHEISSEEAESAIRMAITLCDKLIADDPKKQDYWCTLADAHRWLGVRQAAAGRHQEAEPSYRKSLALLDRVPDQNASKKALQAAPYVGLAQVLRANGRTEESEEAYREALWRYCKIVDDLPYTTSTWGGLSTCCRGLARLLQETGCDQEAEQVREAALQRFANFVGQLPDETLYQDGAIRSASQLFDVLLDGGQQQEMKESYRWALDICEKLANRFPKHVGFRSVTAYWRAAFGSVLFSLGRTEEAKEAFRKAIDESRAVLEKKPDDASTLNNLAWLLATCPDERFRNGSEAVALSKRATELAPRNGCLWNTRGIAHYRVGDWNAAIAALEKSRKVFQNRPEAEALESFSTFFLAMAHWQRGESEIARRWYDKAVRWMDKYQPKDIELQRIRAEARRVVQPELSTANYTQRLFERGPTRCLFKILS